MLIQNGVQEIQRQLETALQNQCSLGTKTQLFAANLAVVWAFSTVAKTIELDLFLAHNTGVEKNVPPSMLVQTLTCGSCVHCAHTVLMQF